MSHTRAEKIEALGRVIDTLERLRLECPWDRKQTNESLRPNTIEEVYELADALEADDKPNIAKELGDVLLHILFYAKIGEETADYDIADVADRLNEKLIYRHPHIFGTVKADTPSQVADNWEKLKMKERGGNATILAGVPKALPSLIKAFRIQEKASHVGFDWPDRAQVWDKVREELLEFEAALPASRGVASGTPAPETPEKPACPKPASRGVASGTPAPEALEEELGDILFTLVNVARLYGINPDTALDRTCRKFIRRFTHIETAARDRGRDITALSLEEMEALWAQAKARE